MEQKNRKIILAVIIVLIAVGFSFLFSKNKATPTETAATVNISSDSMDTFTQCLKDSGAKFYGASWCSHCQNQKKLLNSSKNIPYIECSAPDGKSQLQICTDNKIEGYPTWVFADGSRQSGELSLEILSQKSNCKLPQ
jgi:glutaredoxin